MSDTENNTMMDDKQQDSSANVGIITVESMNPIELKEDLTKLKLYRLRALLYGVEPCEEEDGNESDDDKDIRDQAGVKECTQNMQTLTFKDAEEYLNTFSGDNNEGICWWIREFESMAELGAWSDAQKVINAKRLLRGSAKKFVTYGKCCHTWSEMTRALKSEFLEVADAHRMHEDLPRGIKKSNETYQEYIDRMLNIAKQADMGVTAIIKYIIDGIEDDECNKVILYEARSIRELEEKFEIYETMKENSRAWSGQTKKMVKRTMRRVAVQESAQRCFLCGDRNHLNDNCPTKNKGVKCFKCKGYGHIASACEETEYHVSALWSTSVESQKKGNKDVQIRNYKVSAVISTATNINVMQADCYVKIGAPRLKNRILRFRCGSSNNNYTLGEFSTDIIIDDAKYRINVHVLPHSSMPCDLIIGAMLLGPVTISVKDGITYVRKSDSP